MIHRPQQILSLLTLFALLQMSNEWIPHSFLDVIAHPQVVRMRGLVAVWRTTTRNQKDGDFHIISTDGLYGIIGFV
jgi:hypothetical protein